MCGQIITRCRFPGCQLKVYEDLEMPRGLSSQTETLRLQGCKGQVSADRVVGGIKDGHLMVASNNKYTNAHRRKITLHIWREIRLRLKRWSCPLLSPCRSLAVGHQYSSLGTQPILCGSIPGLVPKQLRFCRNYVEIMPSVAEGVKIGIQECQHQFRGRRWNCTTVSDNLAIFGPVLDKGNVILQKSST